MPMHERREAIVAARGVAHDRANGWSIVVSKASAQRIGEKVFGQGAHELLGTTEQELPEPGHAVELGAVGKDAGRIDRRTGLVDGPPFSDRVEVVERKADRIHPRMAVGADGIAAMLRHRFPHRQPLAGVAGLGDEGGDVRRRRRRRRAEDVRQHVLAAQHRRGPVGIRRQHQDAAVTEQAATRTLIAVGDAPEVGPEYIPASRSAAPAVR